MTEVKKKQIRVKDTVKSTKLNICYGIAGMSRTDHTTQTVIRISLV